MPIVETLGGISIGCPLWGIHMPRSGHLKVNLWMPNFLVGISTHNMYNYHILSSIQIWVLLSEMLTVLDLYCSHAQGCLIQPRGGFF
jgi:hypothetical protein